MVKLEQKSNNLKACIKERGREMNVSFYEQKLNKLKEYIKENGKCCSKAESMREYLIEHVYGDEDSMYHFTNLREILKDTTLLNLLPKREGDDSNNIDPLLKDTISELNRNGIDTKFSCSGHIAAIYYGEYTDNVLVYYHTHEPYILATRPKDINLDIGLDCELICYPDIVRYSDCDESIEEKYRKNVISSIANPSIQINRVYIHGNVIRIGMEVGRYNYTVASKVTAENLHDPEKSLTHCVVRKWCNHILDIFKVDK